MSQRPVQALALPDDLVVLQRDWLSSNNLLCLGEQAAIVDTGHVKHAAQTVRRVRAVLGTQPLATIAHTHLHSDHCGGTGALQAAWPTATTWVPEPSLDAVQRWDEDALSFDGTGQRCARFGADRALVPGQPVRLGAHDWQVHAAPGHDSLAVLLFEPRHGILVSGDALWEHGVGVIFPHIDGSAGFEPFNETLDVIERLAPEIVIPGHGAPFGRAGGAIDAALGRARERIATFQAQPAQHALYAAKVLIKYQMLDVDAMTHADFERWLDAAPSLHLLHQQHRPDLAWPAWLAHVLTPMFSKGVLRRDATHVHDGA